MKQPKCEINILKHLFFWMVKVNVNFITTQSIIWLKKVIKIATIFHSWSWNFLANSYTTIKVWKSNGQFNESFYKTFFLSPYKYAIKRWFGISFHFSLSLPLSTEWVKANISIWFDPFKVMHYYQIMFNDKCSSSDKKFKTGSVSLSMFTKNLRL